MARLACNLLVFFLVTLTSLKSSDRAYAAQSILLPSLSKDQNTRLMEQTLADEPNYRLPNNTEPIHYDIELSTNVHTGNRSFTGKVAIQLRALEDTRSIVVHARQLDNFKATVRKENTQTPYDMEHKYEEEREFLTFTPQSASVNLLKGEIWILTIEYNGTLRTDNGGFYISTYTNKNNNAQNLATTQFESTNARHAFPCYDEPAKRATFRVTMRHDPSYHAISNTPIDTENSSNGVTVFQKTVNMPSYLVAFIVSDFEFTVGELKNLPHRIFSRPGTGKDQEWSLVSGMLLLDSLSTYYGVDFALPKMDQVAVPDFAAGAMENWGLVTYREEYLLYNKKNSTVFTQTSISSTIAHEFTHQWFGDYVTPKWWSYLWLKEGFATLFSYESCDDVYPEWGIYQLFHTSEYQTALSSDSGINSRPMTYYVQKPTDISSLYDSISYSKAGSVLSMWQHALTDSIFRQGLHNYLDNNKFGAAEENDLFAAIQTAAKEQNNELSATIPEMMSSWTRRGGYPVLHVTRNYDNGSFVVVQKPFYSNASHDAEHTWYVPFNFATKSNADFRDTRATHFLLNTKELNVNDAKVSSDDWLLLNKQSTGYYRINYDERNWGLLTQGLIQNPFKIHERNRAQLIHDAYYLSASERLKHGVLMELLNYLPKEDQYAPWSTANGILSTFNRYLSGDSDYNSFKEYVAQLVGNIYDKLGVNDIPGEQHFQIYTRSVVISLACMAGIENCLQETNQKLIDFIQNGIEIEPNLVSQIYCNGLRQSSDDVFNAIYNELMRSNDQAKRRTIISSLGCSQKENQIKKFIESSIDSSNNLRAQERTTLLSPAYSRGEVGLNACIKFLKENWDAYGKLTAGNFGATNPLEADIRGMSANVVTRDQEKALLELLDLVKGSDYVSKTLEQSVKTNMNANFDWLNFNRAPILNWISQSRKNSGNGSASVFKASSIGITLILFLTRLF